MTNSVLVRAVVAATILVGSHFQLARADSCPKSEFVGARHVGLGGQSHSPAHLALTDINADTNLDVVVLSTGCALCTPPTTNTLSVLFGNGDGTFSTNVVLNVDSTLGSSLTAGD